MIRDVGVAESGSMVYIESDHVRVAVAPKTATWSMEAGSSCRVEDIKPQFDIEGFPVDLSSYESSYRIVDISDSMGSRKGVVFHYHKEGALSISYSILVSCEDGDVIVQTDLRNLSGRDLTVNQVASVWQAAVSLGGSPDTWRAIGDAKEYQQHYLNDAVAGMETRWYWWYCAVKDIASGKSILLGNLTNMKGLGRFTFTNADGRELVASAINDYEGIVMPAGAEIIGEKVLVAYGARGVECLERFGAMIARAHGIDLKRDHPILPDDPTNLALFNRFNSWGSAVIDKVKYQFDRTKYVRPCFDPQWLDKTIKAYAALGLSRFIDPTGQAPEPIASYNTLAQEYGHVRLERILTSAGSGKGKSPQGADLSGLPRSIRQLCEIRMEHPEFYINDRIDFSNPMVQEFEQTRVDEIERESEGKHIRYNHDWTNKWSRLPGQYDPFCTSAETYRAAVRPWRELSKRRPGTYGLAFMNIPGINYDLMDIVRMGADSDHGYRDAVSLTGQPTNCSFVDGIIRQISGRFFYNGNVWWNNPDAFHVYAQGSYSYDEAKVHASFISLSGNFVNIAEHFAEEDIPEERVDIIRRVLPTTPDTSIAVDVFEHCPARLWNMPVRRTFGEWNAVGLFNFDENNDHQPITQLVDFGELGLSPDKEYLVYEFWSREFIGVKRGGFQRTLKAPSCEVYSVVEKRSHPQLVSTNRHVRQMAYDIRDLRWEEAEESLAGVSKLVQGDVYELRVFVPEGYTFEAFEADGVEKADISTDGPMLTISFVSPAHAAAWRVGFRMEDNSDERH